MGELRSSSYLLGDMCSGALSNLYYPKANRGANLVFTNAAVGLDSREPEWSAYSGALGRKFFRLDQFLKSTSSKAEGNVPNPKLFQ